MIPWVMAILAVIVVAFLAQRLLSDNTVEPHLVSSRPVAVIGRGSEAVLVAEDGTILAGVALPKSVQLPQLPLEAAPKDGRLQGPALEQVKVLAAAPPALSPYVESSRFGESGVDVKLTSGIELRFGDATSAARKWRAAATVLANPELTALDYVDLHAPGRPAIGGSGHTLPPAP
jgi:cell division septal protein FtsQ